jgi:hypothetical protein
LGLFFTLLPAFYCEKICFPKTFYTNLHIENDLKPKNRLTNKRRGRVFSLPKTAKPLIFLLTKLQFLYEEVFTHPCELVHYGYAQRDGSSRQSGW